MKLVTQTDREALDNFANFLSWIVGTRDVITARRAVPPAWWAHVMGCTTYCPPKGEM